MIDHEAIIRQQNMDQEIVLAMENPITPDEKEEEVELFSDMEEYDDGEERFFEREFSIKGIKIA